MTVKNKIIIGLIIGVLSLALISALKAWYSEKNKQPMSKVEYVTVKEIKTVTKLKRVEVPIEKIVTIEKEKIVEKLKLHQWFAENADEQAIADADLPETETGYEVVATVNTKSGKGNIIAKEKKQSLVGIPNKKEIGFRAGYNTGLTQQTTIYGRWQFFRVGNFYLGAYGEVTSEGKGTAQLDLSYKF